MPISVVDPNPVGSETWGRIRIRKIIPDPVGSGFEIKLKQNNSEKLIKIWQYLNKTFNLKNVNSLFLEINLLKAYISS